MAATIIPHSSLDTHDNGNGSNGANGRGIKRKTSQQHVDDDNSKRSEPKEKKAATVTALPVVTAADQVKMQVIFVDGDRVMGLLPDMICSLCMKPWLDPVETLCHDIFCRGCLEIWLRANRSPHSCPSCRQPLTSGSSDNIKSLQIANPSLYRIISKIQVKCPLYSNNGCEWTGSYNDIITHLSTNCSQHMTTCHQCSQTLIRYQLLSHQTDKCINRNVKCHLCNELMIHSLLDNHINYQCHMASITCHIIHKENIQSPVYTTYNNNETKDINTSFGTSNSGSGSGTSHSSGTSTGHGNNNDTISNMSSNTSNGTILPIIKPINVHGTTNGTNDNASTSSSSSSGVIEVKGCGGTYLRRDINHHQQHDCPKTLITCTRSLMGCDWYGSRETLSQHNNDNMANHLDLVTRAFHLLTSDITRITFERDSLSSVDEMSAKANARPFPFNQKVGDHILFDGYESEILESKYDGFTGSSVHAHYMGWARSYDVWVQAANIALILPLRPNGVDIKPDGSMQIRMTNGTVMQYCRLTDVEKDAVRHQLAIPGQQQTYTGDILTLAPPTTTTAAAAAVTTSAAATTFPANVQIGDHIDVRDGGWYVSQVLDMKQEGSVCTLEIHYLGWAESYDSWIMDTARLAPLHTHTRAGYIPPDVVRHRQPVTRSTAVATTTAAIAAAGGIAVATTTTTRVFPTNVQIGEYIDVYDGGGWYVSEVLDINQQGKLSVHYVGWAESCDEWIHDTTRLAPLHTHTRAGYIPSDVVPHRQSVTRSTAAAAAGVVSLPSLAPAVTAVTASVTAAAAAATTTTTRVFPTNVQIGDDIDVHDGGGWYVSEVLDINQQGILHIHYLGWAESYDSWIHNTARLAPLHTHTRAGYIPPDVVRRRPTTRVASGRVSIAVTQSVTAAAAKLTMVKSPLLIQIGDVVDARGGDGAWVASDVIAVHADNQSVKVHYRGWQTSWDEWLERNSARLAPYMTHTDGATDRGGDDVDDDEDEEEEDDPYYDE